MKKFIRKTLSIVLAVIMVFTVIPLTGTYLEASAIDSRVEAAVQTAIAIANDNSHGYSQSSRWGPDYDCSSLVYYAFSSAGFNFSQAWFNTRNMGETLTSAGFVELTNMDLSNSNRLQRGDILWKEGHTEIYIGNNQLVGAHSDRGYPQTGDQPGNEISVCDYYYKGNNGTVWTKVYRYENYTSPPNPVLNLHSDRKVYNSSEYIDFYWESAYGAQGYWLHMWKDGEEIYSLSSSSTTFKSAPASEGRYTLCIRPYNTIGINEESKSYDFVITDNVPNAVENLRSEKTVYNTNEYINIKWNEAYGTQNYWVYMWKDGEQLYSYDCGLNTSFISSPMSEGQYTFCIRPGNVNGFNETSKSYSFVISDGFEVNYNPNGGAGAPSSQTKTYGTDLALSTTVPTKANYNFVSWNTKADGTGKTYQPGDIYTANEDLTLYAIWEPAHSHSYTPSVAKHPTCTEKGIRKYTCSSCGDTYTEDIDALDHNYVVSGVTEPTCYESGFTTYDCTRCDSSYNTDFTDALNHPLSSWVTVVNPTADSNGLAEKHCDYCGYVSEQFIIPALVPDYVTGVSLSSHKEIVETGDEFTLKATVTPDTAKNKNVIWSSRNPEIATVSNGKVTALKPGTTAIVAETQDGGYIDFCIVSVISVASFNGSVVDNSNKIIYGLTCNLNSIDEYIRPADSSMDIVLDSSKVGTGTTVSIVDGSEVIDTYEIVVFGDIDGNGSYDANDAFLVNMINSGLISADDLGIAERTAADCNHDGRIDRADFELLVQASILLDEVKQSAENGDISTSSLYIDYCSVISQSAELDTEADGSNVSDTTNSEDVAYTFDFIAFFQNVLGLLSKIFSFIVALF